MENANEMIRLNKYLSEAGVCSRREADRLIEEGLVTVDGSKAVTGQKVSPGQAIAVRGEAVQHSRPKVLIAYNKLRGTECTTDSSNPDNIVDKIGYPVRIFPVGRLDKDSTGLILLTNDGSLVNRILKAQEGHEKEYEVTVDKPVTEAFRAAMEQGVDISGNDGRRFLTAAEIEEARHAAANAKQYRYRNLTSPCKVTLTGTHTFNIILTQGLNRQIRRMCLALGYTVTSLNRIRIMDISLDGLAPGAIREVPLDIFS